MSSDGPPAASSGSPKVSARVPYATRKKMAVAAALAEEGGIDQSEYVQTYRGAKKEAVPTWMATPLPSLDRGTKSKLVSFCRREVVVLVKMHMLAQRGVPPRDEALFEEYVRTCDTKKRRKEYSPPKEEDPTTTVAGTDAVVLPRAFAQKAFESIIVNLLPNTLLLPSLLHQLEEHILQFRGEGLGIRVEEGGITVQHFHHAPSMSQVRGLNLPPTADEHRFFHAFRYTDELVRFAARSAMRLDADHGMDLKDYEHFLAKLEYTVAMEDICPLEEVGKFITVGLHIDTHPFPDSLEKIRKQRRVERKRAAVEEGVAQAGAQAKPTTAEMLAEAPVSHHHPTVDIHSVQAVPPQQQGKQKRGGRGKGKGGGSVVVGQVVEPVKPLSEAISQPSPTSGARRDVPPPPTYSSVASVSPRSSYSNVPYPIWTPDAVRRVMGGMVLPPGTDLNMTPPFLMDFYHQQQRSQHLCPALLQSNPHSDDDDISFDDLLPKLDDDEDGGSGVSSQPFVSNSDTPRAPNESDVRSMVVGSNGGYDDDTVSTISASTSTSSSSTFSSVVGSQRGASSGGSRWSSGTTSPFHQALDWRSAGGGLQPPASPMAPLPPAAAASKPRRGRRGRKRKSKGPVIPRPMKPADVTEVEFPTTPPLFMPSTPTLPNTPTTTLSIYRSGASVGAGGGARRRQLTVREALMRVLASAAGSGGGRHVSGRLAITGPMGETNLDSSGTSDDGGTCRQVRKACPQWQHRRYLRKLLQRQGCRGSCLGDNPKSPSTPNGTVWRNSLGKRVVKRPRQSPSPHGHQQHEGSPPLSPTALVPTSTSGHGGMLDEEVVLRARALLRKATFWGRDNIRTVSEALGVEEAEDTSIRFRWNLPLPETDGLDMIPSTDPQHPAAQLRNLSTMLHSAIQQSYFMGGSTLAMSMSSETTTRMPQSQPLPPNGHPNHQSYTTTRSMISVAVTSDKSRLPVVSIPSPFGQNKFVDPSAASGTGNTPPLNVLVALQSDEAGGEDATTNASANSSSAHHSAFPTTDEVVAALSSMVAGLGTTPSSSPTSSSASSGSPTKAASHHHRGHRKGYHHKGIRKRILPDTSSLSGSSKGRNNAIYFANSPIFRALEGFLHSAIAQLPYVAVYQHKEGVISSTEPQLISTEDQPLLLLFLLLSGRSGDEGGGLQLPAHNIGQRLLQ